MSAALLLVACSCGDAFTASPGHTAVDVPIDVRPVISSAWGPVQSASIRAGLEDVSVTTETFESGGFGWITVIPDVPLAPSTVYTVQVVSDDETTEFEFTTGTAGAPAPQTPVVEDLEAARAQIVGGDHTCYGESAQAFDLTMERDPTGVSRAGCRMARRWSRSPSKSAP